MSSAVEPAGRELTVIAMVLVGHRQGLGHSTCLTWLGADAERQCAGKAPCVEVWESPHTIVMPGQRPNWGPTT